MARAGICGSTRTIALKLWSGRDCFDAIVGRDLPALGAFTIKVRVEQL